MPFIKREWSNLQVEGRSDYVLKEKLRFLKVSLLRWDKEHFGIIDLKIEEWDQRINGADLLLESCRDSLVEEVVAERIGAICQMWKKLNLEENLLMQKNKLKWDSKGDLKLNSRFFYGFMKERNQGNFIETILADGGLLETIGEVKEEVRRYYSDIYVDIDSHHLSLTRVQFKALSQEEARSLELPFSETEIKEAVWGCEGSKSPGPDRYNFNFIKKCWSFVKEDFFWLIRNFHGNSHMSKAITSLLLTLIPKKDNPLGLGVTYLIVLCVFVPDRQLLDGVIDANEVVNFAKKAKQSCLLLKVDFEKSDGDRYDMCRGFSVWDPKDGEFSSRGGGDEEQNLLEGTSVTGVA
ncbi:uncharacterized protein LOC131611064 [Vicia villosa]|uniref:uncharacterized protein LOC131611064 n=1 Tax=Vicia villosa TaxID=3911 RepID=UPI00273C29D6|nr:uncharacterized protein LOC131611064 [Vicia villosa]